MSYQAKFCVHGLTKSFSNNNFRKKNKKKCKENETSVDFEASHQQNLIRRKKKENELTKKKSVKEIYSPSSLTQSQQLAHSHSSAAIMYTLQRQFN